MENKTEQPVDAKMRQLIAEVNSSGKSVGSATSSGNGDDATHLFSILFRWSFFGLLCLGLGFWVGRTNALITYALNSPSGNQSSSLHEGWRTDGTGVFYRWCSGSCNAPRLYGGGVIQVFEVHCADRPCGDLAMHFNVLNAEGQTIDKIFLREKGLQGELRRFMIESQISDATSIELSEFYASARV